MLRALSVALTVSVLCLGVAAAKPGPFEKPVPSPVPSKKQASPFLDPVWAKQLVQSPLKVPSEPQPMPVEAQPDFAKIRRMTPVQRAIMLQAPAPEQVQGPLRFSARQNYQDNRHFLALYSRGGRLNVLTGTDRVYLGESDATRINPLIRPLVEVHFVAEPGRRYLLECAVDIAGDTGGTITATGPGATYAVSTDDKATLLFRHDGGAMVEDVMVWLVGDRPWYFESCELSWTGP